MKLISIVLAAGRGLRFGGPKALVAWPREGGCELPLAAVHALVRLDADSERVLVVTRDDTARVLRQHAGEVGAEWLISHADDALGPAGSLAAAAECLRGQVNSEQIVLVSPVDCPPACRAVVATLHQQLSEHPQALAVRPRRGKRRGHPVLLRASVLDAYCCSEPPPLREVLRGLADRVIDCEIDDETVLAGFNTVSEWAVLSGRDTATEPSFFS